MESQGRWRMVVKGGSRGPSLVSRKAPMLAFEEGTASSIQAAMEGARSGISMRKAPLSLALEGKTG